MKRVEDAVLALERSAQAQDVSTSSLALLAAARASAGSAATSPTASPRGATSPSPTNHPSRSG